MASPGYERWRARWWLEPILVLALTACQTSPSRDLSAVAETERVVRSELARPDSPASPPQVVEQALLPALPLPGERSGRPHEPRFAINVSELPAAEFFMGLVEGTDYNMVVHPGVSGGVTLNLKAVTVPEVMQIVRDVYGFDYRRTRWGFEVLPARLRARIFHVNYLNVKRSGSSQTRVSSGQISQVERHDSSAGGDSPGTGSVTGTEINTIQPETSFWSELKAAVAAILAGGEGRSVVVNPQTGVVVVRAMPGELREIETYLRDIQAIAARQVVLEAKILEVVLNDGYQAGINWAAVIKDGQRSITAAQVGGAEELDGGGSPIRGNTGDLNPDALVPIVGTAAQAFGGVFSLAINLTDITGFIELLETQGNVQVLSSPRVSTLNNQKAVIKVGTDEFFVTDISTTTVTGTTTTTTPSVELTPFFSGIALDVTPQISEDGEVILHVHPTVSEVQDDTKRITVGDVTQDLPLALSDIRESDSVVRARSGQLVVIGGLMRDRLVDDQAQTPGLGDLPAVGALFRHRRSRSIKTELVILLRPLVVDDRADWRETLSDTAAGLRRLREGYGAP